VTLPWQSLRWFAQRVYYNLRIQKNRRRPVGAEPWSCTHRLGREERHVLCGYHDVTPFDARETRCAALAAPALVTAAYDGSAADIGWFDLTEREPRWRGLASTRTWCWQQGARLRWHPTKADLMVYNDAQDGNGICRLQDATTGRLQQQLPMPLYDLAPDGRHGLSLDFNRLHAVRRGYGYPSVKALAPEQQGIWVVDLEGARCELAVPIAELERLDPVASMANAQHYVNHISWSPDGSQFVALHLWLSGGRRLSRMIVGDFPHGRCRVLVNTGYAGHYCWLKPGRLLIFVGNQGEDSGFHLYNTLTGERKPVALASIREDGHPAPLAGDYEAILDTYPDALGFAQLFRLNLETEATVDIGRFHHPVNFRGDYRCDLHPRPSPSGRMIAVDTVVAGRRVVSVLARLGAMP